MNIIINSTYLENVYGIYFVDISQNKVVWASENKSGTYVYNNNAVANDRFIIVPKEGCAFDDNTTYQISCAESPSMSYLATGKTVNMSDYNWDTVLQNYTDLPVKYDCRPIYFTGGETPKYYRNYYIGQDITPINATGTTPITYDITFDYFNFSFYECTCNTADKAKVNPNDKIIVTADSGYSFPTDFDYYLDIDYWGETEYLTCQGVLSDNNTILTYTVPDNPNVKTLSLNHSITADPITPPTPTGKEVTIHFNGKTFTNCSVNCSDGGTIQEGNTLQVTANSGYRFNSTVSLGNDTTGTQSVQMVNNINTLSLRIAKDTFDDLYFLSDVIADVEPIVAQDGFCHIYRPTDQELSDLSNVIFITLNNEQISFTEYIIRLYKLPFTIDNSMIKGKEYIKLGSVGQAQVQADKLQVWKFAVDLGSIAIPDKYNNVYSYKVSNIRLYVPYFGNYDLATDNIGQTISIGFTVDLYNEETTLSVKRNNAKLISDSRKIGNDIPFFHKDYANITETDTGVIEDTFTPFIEVIRNKPHNIDGYLGKTERFYSKLNDLTGYVEVADIDLTGSNIPYDLQSRIQTQLEQGVIL